MKRDRKKKGRNCDPTRQACGTKDDKTTIRAKVTEDEHEAVRWVAKVRFSMTIEDFVREAVSVRLKDLTGKTLATLAEEQRNRGKPVQGELF